MYFYFGYMGFPFIVSMFLFRIKPVCLIFQVYLIWKSLMHGKVLAVIRAIVTEL